MSGNIVDVIPTILIQSFETLQVFVLFMEWRCACGLEIFTNFSHFFQLLYLLFFFILDMGTL